MVSYEKSIQAFPDLYSDTGVKFFVVFLSPGSGSSLPNVATIIAADW